MIHLPDKRTFENNNAIKKATKVNQKQCKKDEPYKI